MAGDTQGSRIRAVREARGEALEPFAAAMNAILPREEHARSTTVWRWEKDEGSPSVRQGLAIMRLDPKGRDIHWLGGDAQRALRLRVAEPDPLSFHLPPMTPMLPPPSELLKRVAAKKAAKKAARKKKGNDR